MALSQTGQQRLIIPAPRVPCPSLLVIGDWTESYFCRCVQMVAPLSAKSHSPVPQWGNLISEPSVKWMEQLLCRGTSRGSLVCETVWKVRGKMNCGHRRYRAWSQTKNCTALHCTALQNTALCCIVLHTGEVCCTVLYSALLHHCTTKGGVQHLNKSHLKQILQSLQPKYLFL